MIKANIKVDTDQIVEIGECYLEVEFSTDRIIEEGHNMITLIEGDFRRGNFRRMQSYRGQKFRGAYRGNYQNEDFGRGRSRSRERQYSRNFRRYDQSSIRSRSGSRASTDRGQIRCFKCREYDHFAKDCLNSDTEKEQSEQIQQMFN